MFQHPERTSSWVRIYVMMLSIPFAAVIIPLYLLASDKPHPAFKVWGKVMVCMLGIGVILGGVVLYVTVQMVTPILESYIEETFFSELHQYR